LTVSAFLLAAVATGTAAQGAGADANSQQAAIQDQKDINNNAQVVGEGALARDAAAAPANNAPNPQAKGGKGGTDPATGEQLFPLPEESAFCKKTGQQAMDGTQNRGGDCSSAAQGQIPSVDNMVSTLIIEPENLAKLPLGKEFEVAAIVDNMSTGFFTDPQIEYYTQPQLLDSNGRIKGHNHVTIQKIRDPRVPPNAQDKQFFKGLNFAADGDGKMSVKVDAGSITEPGIYRICTMAGTFSHQPVIMPIAQRGAQDDCIRVEFVADGGNNGNDAAAGGNQNNGAAAGNDNQGNGAAAAAGNQANGAAAADANQANGAAAADVNQANGAAAADANQANGAAAAGANQGNAAGDVARENRGRVAKGKKAIDNLWNIRRQRNKATVDGQNNAGVAAGGAAVGGGYGSQGVTGGTQAGAAPSPEELFQLVMDDLNALESAMLRR